MAELTRIAEDVYVYRSQNHQSIFIVTDEGVIATDPIGQANPRSPQLYRAAIAAVTDQPVRYVVYSHDHQDHNEGGYVFYQSRLTEPHIREGEDPSGTWSGTWMVREAVSHELEPP
ncbi:MAG: hypothetical protein M3O34_10445 [Chloroflexota bacterium]|nr:hypothetical protein [Chloroflexota bacterium]